MLNRPRTEYRERERERHTHTHKRNKRLGRDQVRRKCLVFYIFDLSEVQKFYEA